MSDLDHAFSSGILAPYEVKLLQGIYARIASEPWFTKEDDQRLTFAVYILKLYRRGMTIPKKLEAICGLAARAHFAAGDDQARLGQPLRGRNFLVVEDEILLARDVCKRLISVGADVTGPVGTVSDALDLLESGELDAALLDIALNGEPVYPVAAMLRLKNIPFAFVSGHDNPDVPPAFRNVPVFPKPTDWTRVAAHLVTKEHA